MAEIVLKQKLENLIEATRLLFSALDLKKIDCTWLHLCTITYFKWDSLMFELGFLEAPDFFHIVCLPAQNNRINYGDVNGK